MLSAYVRDWGEWGKSHAWAKKSPAPLGEGAGRVPGKGGGGSRSARIGREVVKGIVDTIAVAIALFDLVFDTG